MNLVRGTRNSKSIPSHKKMEKILLSFLLDAARIQILQTLSTAIHAALILLTARLANGEDIGQGCSFVSFAEDPIQGSLSLAEYW
jgi:hypothetical protein